MNIALTGSVVLLLCILILAYLNRKLRTKLEAEEDKRKAAEKEAESKEKELEAIKDVQTKLKEVRETEKPEVVAAPDSGDSDIRLSRLNRLSDESAK